MKGPSENGFFLSQDDDSHWYIIPIERQQEWDNWRAMNDDFSVPPYAIPVNGAPRRVVFKQYDVR